MSSRRYLFVLGLVACATLAAGAAGCGKKHGGGKGTGGGGGGDRDHGVAPVPGQVSLLLDGKAVANADRAAAEKWTPLADLYPASVHDTKIWSALEIHTATGRVTTMPEPAATQPGLVPALFPGKDGIDFGMFTADELAKHGTPKLVEMNVTDVRVALAALDQGSGSGSGSASGTGSGTGSTASGSSTGGGNGEGNGSNRGDGGVGPDLSGIKMTIKQKSGDVDVTGADLEKIAKVAPPTGDTSTTGWDLASILAAKKIKPTAKLILTDDSGTTVTMTAKQLDPKTDLAFMKVNKQGQVRFRLFEKNAGGAWDVAGELRGVTTIELVP